MKVTSEPLEKARCIASPGDPVWENDYKALTAAISGKPDENAIRRAVAKYLL